MTDIHAHRLATGGPGPSFEDVVAALKLDPPMPLAACKGVPGGLWDDRRDVPGGEQPTARTARIQKAQSICRGCPERAECLRRRVADDTLGHGVFGGEVFTDEPQDATCPWCGEGFRRSARRYAQVYCHATCREAAKTARVHGTGPLVPAQGRPPALTHCQACNEPLSKQRQARGGRTCNKTCQQRAESQRRTERRQQNGRYTRLPDPSAPVVVPCEVGGDQGPDVDQPGVAA
jgi:hypothetical protein